MMDISTKRFSLRSNGDGIPGATVQDKRTGACVTVARSDLPGRYALAMMSESAFDKMAAGLVAKGGAA